MMTAQNNDEWAEQEIWRAVQGQITHRSVNVAWHSFISYWFPILNRFVILTELLSHLKGWEGVPWPLSKECSFLVVLYTICHEVPDPKSILLSWKISTNFRGQLIGRESGKEGKNNSTSKKP